MGTTERGGWCLDETQSALYTACTSVPSINGVYDRPVGSWVGGTEQCNCGDYATFGSSGCSCVNGAAKDGLFCQCKNGTKPDGTCATAAEVNLCETGGTVPGTTTISVQGTWTNGCTCGIKNSVLNNEGQYCTCGTGYIPNSDYTACVMAQPTCANGSTHYDDGLCLYAARETTNGGMMTGSAIGLNPAYATIANTCSNNGLSGNKTMEYINIVYSPNRYGWVNGDDSVAGYIATNSSDTIYPKSQCAIPVEDRSMGEMFIVRNNTWWATNKVQDSYLSYENAFADFSMALLGITSTEFKSNLPAYDMIPYDKTVRVFTNKTGVTFNRGANVGNAIADDPNKYMDLVMRKEKSTVTLPDWNGVMTKYLIGKPENCTLTGINAAADGSGKWYWQGAWSASNLIALDNQYSAQIGAIPMYMIWNCQ